MKLYRRIYKEFIDPNRFPPFVPDEKDFLCEGNFYCRQVLKIKGDYFVVATRTKEIGLAERIEHLNLKGKERECTQNLTCPYCGYEDKNSWEIGRNDGEEDCGRCGSVFSFRREVVVEFSTYSEKLANITEVKE